MSDSASRPLSIAITPMHRTEEGLWESGPREEAQVFLVELVRGDGEDVEVVVECRDERTAALAARVTAGTLAALGLAEGVEQEARVDAFDEETAAILADNPTPEVEVASGDWRDLEEDEEDDDEEEEDEDEPRAGRS